MSDKEQKDYQETPDNDLMDKIYQLGRLAQTEYGEKILGDFLVTVAYRYKTKEFELEMRKAALQQALALEEFKKHLEKARQEAEEGIIDGIDFSKEKVH